MQNRTTAAFIFNRLKEEVIVGNLKPGQQLVERELTRQFGVSRTPLREALQQLVRSQLAINVPYRGVFIRKIGYEYARNIYDVRFGIEGAAAYFAAQRATDDDLRAIEDVFHEIEKFSRENNRDKVLVLNNEFHKALAEATHNALLVESVDELWTNVNLLRATAWQGNTRTEGSRAEHESILQAIVDRDPDAARSATENHIKNSWQLVKSSLEESARQEDDEDLP
jgi:DNA-binding GntR family transcriptional regulator